MAKRKCVAPKLVAAGVDQRRQRDRRLGRHRAAEKSLAEDGEVVVVAQEVNQACRSAGSI